MIEILMSDFSMPNNKGIITFGFLMRCLNFLFSHLSRLYFKYWPTEAIRTQERPCVMNSILDLILQTLFQLVPVVTTENARMKFKSFLDSTISSSSTFTDFFLTTLIFSDTKTVVLGSFKMFLSIGVKRHLFNIEFRERGIQLGLNAVTEQ